MSLTQVTQWICAFIYLATALRSYIFWHKMVIWVMQPNIFVCGTLVLKALHGTNLKEYERT
jgi:Na+/melibiose symporter-like transporter